MTIQPYLFFDGRCEEAIEFYKKALDAKVEMMMRWRDSPEPNPMCTPDNENKIMHASMTINGSVVMASDGNNTGHPKFEGFSLALYVKDEAHAKKMFDALADGGQVTMPLSRTFFAKSFGMVSDKFAMRWMILAE